MKMGGPIGRRVPAVSEGQTWRHMPPEVLPRRRSRGSARACPSMTGTPGTAAGRRRSPPADGKIHYERG